ncbi:MAG: response regulator [Archangium sp.]|nr:response regulator [Archangium sp.]
MSIPTADSDEIAVLAPTGDEGPLKAEALRAAGFTCRVVTSIDALLEVLPNGLAAAVITEEALPPKAVARVEAALAAQPAWSDFPLILLGSAEAWGRLSTTYNVTMLDRPVRGQPLVSAVRSALRARRRQYEARHAITQRDRFLAILGHELRNPLGAIVFATERLRFHADAAHTEQHVERVHRQAIHMTKLVDDLLEVSRITTGKIQLEKQVIGLAPVLQRALDTLDQLRAAERIRVSFSVSQPPAVVEGDVIRLEQVFGNIITNAFKYTPTGGSIAISLGVEGDEAVVRVTDTGAGLEPHMLTRVFEIFAQVENSLDRSRGGMGLGLTLVRSLVEQHGGRVEAQSEGLGKGSTFIVRLPRTDRVAPTGEGTMGTVETTVAPMRLAVVEDNDDIRDMLKELLELEGHTVAAANDGRSGLELLTKNPPELAFVDIGLPGLDGYQVAEAVRRAVGSKVWLVAMSGYSQPEDRARALQAGFDAHLSKPVDEERLQAAMLTAQRARASTATKLG